MKISRRDPGRLRAGTSSLTRIVDGRERMVDSISSGYVFYRETHVEVIECVWGDVEMLAHGGRGGRGI